MFENNIFEHILADSQSSESEAEDEPTSTLPRTWKTHRDHPTSAVIGDLSHGTKTRGSHANEVEYIAFLSQIEPKDFKEAILDENWGIAMK